MGTRPVDHVTSPEQPEPALCVRGVTRMFGSVEALTDVNLTVAPGQVFALLGHNGSGKTTLARIAAGELAPTAGSVLAGGVNPHDPAQVVPARRAVAYAPAAPVFYDDLTIREHLELVAAGHQVADGDGRIDELLEMFGLTARAGALADTLSTGMRQKAQLVATLLRPADLYLFDEPVANLDFGTQDALAEHLRAVAAGGSAIVVITHQFPFAEGVASTGAVLHEGAVAAAGPLDELALR